MKQPVLKHEVSQEYKYDREQALRLYHLLRDDVAADSSYAAYVAEHTGTTDDVRIIALFEILHESLLGDIVFGDLGNFDQGSTLDEREHDE